MLQMKTSLLQGSRVDLDAEAWVLASGVTGTFVEIKNDKACKPTAGNMASPVWSESNRDGSAGFSPDVMALAKVTVFYGKLRAVTDQYTGTPAAGDKLYVDATGKLTTVSAGNGVVVAYCTKPEFETTRLSTAYKAIEYILA